MRLVPLLLGLLLALPLLPGAPAGGAGAALAGRDALAHATISVEATSAGSVATISDFSGEPNLAVAPDGTVYVSGLAQSGTFLYRRAPGAASFDYLGTPDSPYGGNDEAISVGADGSVWLAGLYGYFSGGACVSASRSADRGASWTTFPNVCTVRANDRQWIAALDAQRAYVVANEVCCDGAHVAYATTDGGVTWSAQGLATGVGGFPGNLFVSAANDEVYEATTCSPLGGNPEAACLFAASTLSANAPWRPAGAIKLTTQVRGLDHLTGAADDAGNLYLAWIDQTAGVARPGVFVARSSDKGLTWSTPLRVNGPSLATMPWIAAGADGRVAVAWYDAGVTGSDPNAVASSVAWNVKAALLTGWTDAATPTPQVVTLSSVPNHLGKICTIGSSCAGIDRSLLDFFEARVGPDGHLLAVWPDNANGSWVLRVADVPAGLR